MFDWRQWFNDAHKVRVASFCGPSAAGNQHNLVYHAQPIAWNNGLSDELRQIPNLILVSGPLSNLRAQFWDRGQAVKRCGSGNIAISAFAHQHLLNSDLFSLQLQTPAGPVLIGHDRFGPFYIGRPEPQRPITHTGLWRNLLGGDFLAGALSGGASDYALLELDRSPASVQPRIEGLRRFSRRALIAFCPLGPGNVQMRYFAPQYGNDEDAATGSAAVQVAEYLWQRYHWRSCWVIQQSAVGGLIRTEKLSRQLRVRGEACIQRL